MNHSYNCRKCGKDAFVWEKPEFLGQLGVCAACYSCRFPDDQLSVSTEVRERKIRSMSTEEAVRYADAHILRYERGGFSAPQAEGQSELDLEPPSSVGRKLMIGWLVVRMTICGLFALIVLGAGLACLYVGSDDGSGSLVAVGGFLVIAGVATGHIALYGRRSDRTPPEEDRRVHRARMRSLKSNRY